MHVDMHINEISGQIVDAAIQVHSVLGPGLLERAYQICLAHELKKRGLAVRREVLAPVRYDGVVLDAAYRIDLLVEDCVVVRRSRSERSSNSTSRSCSLSSG